MRRHLGPIGVVLLITALGTPCFAEGNANFILGGRTMSAGDFWSPFDSQSVSGADVDFGRTGWPIHLETGMQESRREETISGNQVKGSISEIFFGVNKTWGHGRLHPFVGGGGASVTGKIKSGGVSVEDTSKGFYVHGGVYWRRGRRFNIGFDVRALIGTKLTIASVDTDADYAQGGLLLGWGWPAQK